LPGDFTRPRRARCCFACIWALLRLEDPTGRRAAPFACLQAR